MIFSTIDKQCFASPTCFRFENYLKPTKQFLKEQKTFEKEQISLSDATMERLLSFSC